jgi:hypothetical protein
MRTAAPDQKPHLEKAPAAAANSSAVKADDKIIFRRVDSRFKQRLVIVKYAGSGHMQPYLYCSGLNNITAMSMHGFLIT